jgi:predicted glycosyltransferase
MGKTVWIDLENSPHVLFFRPWIDWLAEAGCDVLLTARDLSQTHELLRLHKLEFTAVGGHGGGSRSRKALRTAARALALWRHVRGREITLALGHGSRAQVLAAAAMGIPSVSFIDYEYVALRLFGLLCKRVFFPQAVGADTVARRGIPPARVVFYPGFKEQVYLSADTDVPHPADPPLILVRPPARRAHYHTTRSEQLYGRLIERLAAEASGAEVMFLPRYPEDRAEIEALCARHPHMTLPEEVRPGRELLLAASLVVSGGGTMVREAAVLGIPAGSFFAGPLGGVDRALSAAGRLHLLQGAADVDRLVLPGSPQATGRSAAPPPERDQIPSAQEVRSFLKTEIGHLL